MYAALPPLVVGEIVRFRRLGEREYRESRVKAIYRSGGTVELETGDIGPAESLLRYEPQRIAERSDA